MTNVPCGMANLGNTCFLNSCIQILIQIEEIAQIHESSNVSQNNDDALIVNEFILLRRSMQESTKLHTSPVIHPGKFVHSIHRVAQNKNRELFTGWAQNDLSEFLLFMIECMHKSRRRAVQIRLNGKSLNDTDKLAVECYTMLKDTYEKGDYSEFSELFEGVHVSRLSTPDGLNVHSIRPEIFGVLDLPIPLANGPSCHLYDCFDVFVAEEILSGWKNDKTGQHESVRKNMVFWNFPKILIITLKRYSSDGRSKNNVLVDFPLDNLDLSPYVVGYKANTYKYRLFGVANHMGGINGGHYTAFALSSSESFAKRNVDAWHCYNDDRVSEIDPNQVVSPAAYCLFYRKQS